MLVTVGFVWLSVPAQILPLCQIPNCWRSKSYWYISLIAEERTVLDNSLIKLIPDSLHHGTVTHSLIFIWWLFILLLDKVPKRTHNPESSLVERWELEGLLEIIRGLSEASLGISRVPAGSGSVEGRGEGLSGSYATSSDQTTCYHIILLEGLFLSTSYSTDLLVMISFSFCMSGKAYFSFVFEGYFHWV